MEEKDFYLSESEKEVYNILKKNRLPMQRKEIVKLVSFNPSSVYGILTRLERKNLVKKLVIPIGVGRPQTLWKIDENGGK